MEAKKKKTKLWVSLLALALMLVYSLFGNAGNLEPSGAPAPTMKTLDEVEPRIPIHASDLPLTITEPNSYYLVEDIHFTSTSTNAITIDCDDVTIDLMGYTLKGPNSGDKSGVRMDGCRNVEIRNGTIRDFGKSAISGAGNSYRVINIRALSNNTYGIYLLFGEGHLVKDCTVAANSFYGIYVHGSTVTGNTCCSNGDHGIYTGLGCTIIGNTAKDNSNYGIYAFGHCLIDQNTAYGNIGGNMFAGLGCVLRTNCAP